MGSKVSWLIEIIQMDRQITASLLNFCKCDGFKDLKLRIDEFYWTNQTNTNGTPLVLKESS